MLTFYRKEYPLNSVTWNFTSAGHGKSAADEIGGTLKRMSDNYNKNGNDVLCADDVIEVVKHKNNEIRPFIVTEQEINDVRNELPERELATVNQTMKIHQVLWTRKRQDDLYSGYLSCNNCFGKTHCNYYHLSAANFEDPSVLKKMF